MSDITSILIHGSQSSGSEDGQDMECCDVESLSLPDLDDEYDADSDSSEISAIIIHGSQSSGSEDGQDMECCDVESLSLPDLDDEYDADSDSSEISAIIIDNSQSSGSDQEGDSDGQLPFLSDIFHDDHYGDISLVHQDNETHTDSSHLDTDDDYVFGTLDICDEGVQSHEDGAGDLEQTRHHMPSPNLGTSSFGFDNCDKNNPTCIDNSLVTGVGLCDYSLLHDVKLDTHNNKGNAPIMDTKFPISDFRMNGLECQPFAPVVSDRSPREMTRWLPPDKLLAMVETKLFEGGPRLAESGTLGRPTFLDSEWSKPLVPFVVGELAERVPKTRHVWYRHNISCYPHKGRNVLSQTATEPSASFYNHTYGISAPTIHASSLMAMVVSCNMENASCCSGMLSCDKGHHIEDIVVNTTKVYADIMDEIGKMNSWPYVQRFVDTESFTYTTQVFVHGVYSRQLHALGKIVHTDLTLIYPKVMVPLHGIVLSAAMRECFVMPTRGLVEIKSFSLVIECHGPRPCRYFEYAIDPLHKRMGIVCVCDGDESGPPCSCAQHYVATLVNPLMANPHPIAALHAARLPTMTSVIAFNIFLLIDELIRGNVGKEKMDTTMRGNNVILQVGNYTDKAAFILHDMKYSFSHQPSLFTEIHLSHVLLKTANDVVNCTAQMCVTVLFIMRYGNPDRTDEKDKKYNDIVKQITEFFATLNIKQLPPPDDPAARSVLVPSYACGTCGGDKAFIKKAQTSVLVCEDCDTPALRDAFYTKLTITKPSDL